MSIYLLICLIFIAVLSRFIPYRYHPQLTTDEKLYWERAREGKWAKKSDLVMVFLIPFTRFGISTAKVAMICINIIASYTVFLYASALGFTSDLSVLIALLFLFNPLTIYLAPRMLAENFMYLLVPLFLYFCLFNPWIAAVVLVLLLFTKDCAQQMVPIALIQGLIYYGEIVTLAPIFLALLVLPLSTKRYNYARSFGVGKSTLIHATLALLATALLLVKIYPAAVVATTWCLSYNLWMCFSARANWKDSVRLESVTAPAYSILLVGLIF